MTRIGLISDTHGHLDERIFHHFEDCDEIWHAGDFGTLAVADTLDGFKPMRGVYGNIDGHEIRAAHPLHQKFMCEGVSVWITHIGGYPGRYDHRIRDEIRKDPPKLFITGHSHILKVVNDKKLKLLHMNPGAAGNVGFHKVRTLLKFEIDGEKIQNLNLIELGPKSIQTAD
ncbi:MAG: putative phosphoesterase [Sphingobacteriales bacterium]|jgi:putative phosphoesterase